MSDCTACAPANTRETVTSRLNQLMSLSEDIRNATAFALRRTKGGITDDCKEPDPDCIETQLDITLGRLSLARDYLNSLCETIN